MLRKILSVILSFLLVNIGFNPSGLSFAQDKDIYYVAVLGLDAKEGVSQTQAEFLNDHLCGQTTRLVNSLKYKKREKTEYIVIERSEMKRILDEQGFQMTGCTDVSCAVEAGKILNVERIIIGSVSIIDKKTYSISARMVDVETGEIIAPADYLYTGNKKDIFIKKGIPDIVYELFYGKKKSHLKIYLITGIAIVVLGIGAYIYLNQPEEDGTISIRIPVPTD